MYMYACMPRTAATARRATDGSRDVDRMESSSADIELLRLLAAELRLDGGCTELSLLPTYNPRIRRLLGERKLWAVVREHTR